MNWERVRSRAVPIGEISQLSYWGPAGVHHHRRGRSSLQISTACDSTLLGVAYVGRRHVSVNRHEELHWNVTDRINS